MRLYGIQTMVSMAEIALSQRLLRVRLVCRGCKFWPFSHANSPRLSIVCVYAWRFWPIVSAFVFSQRQLSLSASMHNTPGDYVLTKQHHISLNICNLLCPRPQQLLFQFVCADVYGVFSWAFSDFGANFEVVDSTGEEPRQCFISNITKVAIESLVVASLILPLPNVSRNFLYANTHTCTG